jgi:hypothetical protein
VRVVRARGIERTDQDVLVVSVDRLIPVLRALGAVEKRAGNPRQAARV